MTNVTLQMIRERHRRGDWCVWTAGMLTDKGGAEVELVCKYAPKGAIRAHHSYQFFGEWKNRMERELRFVADTFVAVEPMVLDKQFPKGLFHFFRNVAGLGRQRVSDLYELGKELGIGPIDVLIHYPELAAKRLAKGRSSDFTTRLVNKARDRVIGNREEMEIELKLTVTLAGRGFPRNIIQLVKEKWGDSALTRVTFNPYCLMKISGCGFSRCDQLYKDLGKRLGSVKRQTLLVEYFLRTRAKGSTWMYWGDIERMMVEELGGDTDASGALRLGIRAGMFEKRMGDAEKPYYALKREAVLERSLAEIVADKVTKGPVLWPNGVKRGDMSTILGDNVIDGRLSDLDEMYAFGQKPSLHQQEAIEKAMSRRVGILTGFAGTGKTFVLAKLVRWLVKNKRKVSVVAPTGKAAVRAKQQLIDVAGVSSIRPTTIHQFLGVKGFIDGEWFFEHHRDNPANVEFLIVDEASMVTMPLMATMFEALPESCHVLLVGDPAQLPPIGGGYPLRDLIRSGVPCGRMVELKRNAGLIARVANQVRSGTSVDALPGEFSAKGGDNLVLKEFEGEAAQEFIVEIVTGISKVDEDAAMWNVQVIVPLNAKSPVSCAELNRKIQAVMNGKNRPRSEVNWGLWEGDKIICVRNSWLTEVFGEDKVYVANGDMGKVRKIHGNTLEAEFRNPERIVLVPRGDKGFSEHLKLGYAITVHKAQGSENNLIVVALDGCHGARYVTSRSWLYTAITRASKRCLLVGRMDAMNAMIRKDKDDKRVTFLTDEFKAAYHRITANSGGQEGKETI